ncbi:hypothetical protein Btru_040737 [Bulinus truncatus]|nr:hypothetical protein Btru_040737 [Bulinus truncatus]
MCLRVAGKPWGTACSGVATHCTPTHALVGASTTSSSTPSRNSLEQTPCTRNLHRSFLVNNYAYMVADLSNNNYVLVDVGDATMVRIVHKQRTYIYLTPHPITHIPDKQKWGWGATGIHVVYSNALKWAAIVEFISKIKEAPDAILTTHKHWDHSGGNRTMRRSSYKLRVYGGSLDHVPDGTDGVNDQDIQPPEVHGYMDTWPHPWTHCPRLSGEEFGVADSIFSGDHLMLAGCGAAFEGPLKQMISSLELLNLLPPETMVWPGHEMGLENLELAAYVRPDNIACGAETGVGNEQA